MVVDAYTPGMLRVAGMYVSTLASAEEVVQDTWLAVVRGIDAFEGRASLRTWIYAILVNQARARGRREQPVVPFAALAADEARAPFHAVDPDRFLPPDAAHEARHWASAQRHWDELPVERLEARETVAAVVEAMRALPPAQRTVMALRDLEGLTSEEVCEALGITLGNQRVLLHRARSRVRAALEHHLDA